MLLNNTLWIELLYDYIFLLNDAMIFIYDISVLITSANVLSYFNSYLSQVFFDCNEITLKPLDYRLNNHIRIN